MRRIFKWHLARSPLQYCIYMKKVLITAMALSVSSSSGEELLRSTNCTQSCNVCFGNFRYYTEPHFSENYHDFFFFLCFTVDFLINILLAIIVTKKNAKLIRRGICAKLSVSKELQVSPNIMCEEKKKKEQTI